MTLHLRAVPDEARQPRRDRYADVLTLNIADVRARMEKDRKAISASKTTYERKVARAAVIRDEEIAQARIEIAECEEILDALEPARAKLAEAAE